MYKNGLKITYEKILFFIALFFAVLNMYIQNTGFIKYISPQAIKTICISCIVITILKVIFFDLDFWVSHFLRLLIIVSLTLIAVRESGVIWYDSVLTFVLLIIASRNQDFTDICDFIFKVSFLFILVTICAYYLGYIYEPPIDQGGRIRSYLGFTYPTIGSIRYIATVFCGMYSIHNKSKNGVSYFWIVLFFAINVFLYKKTDTRLAFGVIFVFLTAYVLIYKFKIKIRTFPEKISIFVFWFLFLGSLFIPKYYDSGNQIWEFINIKFTNTRLALSKKALEKYSINMFGQVIRTHYNETEGYFYIDSGYLHFVLVYGLLLISALMLIYTLIYSHEIKEKQWILVIWMILMFLYNVMNEWLISVDKCACAFAIWELQDKFFMNYGKETYHMGKYFFSYNNT